MAADSYIRGSAVEVDGQRVGRALALAGLGGLLVLIVILTLGAAHQNARRGTIERHGVPVNVTVTSCFGVASGTGATNTGFVCRGSYSLDGHRYNETIGGTSVQLATGAVIPAYAVPGQPSLLSTSAAVERGHSSIAPYVTPIVLTGLLLPSAAAVAWWWRRPRAGEAGGPPAQPAAATEPSPTELACPVGADR